MTAWPNAQLRRIERQLDRLRELGARAVSNGDDGSLARAVWALERAVLNAEAAAMRQQREVATRTTRSPLEAAP